MSGENVSVLENDNRIFERIPCKLDVQVYNPTMDRTYDVCAADFSAGGLRVISEEPFPHKDEVELKIYFSDEAAPITKKAQVVWGKYEGSRLWNIGLKFMNINFSKFAPLMAGNYN